MFTSILRTVVPALWGSFIGWLLTIIPILEPLRNDLLAYADILLPVISAVLIASWYAFWRWLEPRLPDWLTRVVLGSIKSPMYDQHTAEAKVVLKRAQLEGWSNTPPLTGSDWRKFAESLPASEYSTTLLAVADALDQAAPDTDGPDHRAE